MMRIKVLKEIDPSTLRDPIAIVGMPGIARVGKLAVISLIVGLGAEKIMEVFPYDFPAWVIVNKNGVSKLLRSAFFIWRGEDRDIFFLTGDAQPISPHGLYQFTKFVAETFHNWGCKLIISLAAYSMFRIPKTPRVHVAATSDELLEYFSEHRNAVKYQGGTITGANGTIPVFCKTLFGIDGVALLAETHENLRLDPNASRALVELLNDKLELNLDLVELERKIRGLKDLSDLLGIDEEESPEERGKPGWPYVI